MKKVSLLSMVAALLFGGSLAAQTVLINDDFESYPLGGRIAESAIAAGNDWWTTWYNHPGSTTEDGVIAEAGGTQCGYISGSNDNVLLLGGQESGTYDLEFAIFCDEGKYGYFNILHEFNGNGSTWAMQAYLNATNDGSTTSTTYSVGHGTVHAGANANADIPAVVNEWMYFRIRVDLDADVAELFYRSETTQPEEISIVSWQWSKDSFGQSVVGRKMDAMDFFAPHATLGCYYLDNFKYTRIGEETAASLDFDTEEVNLWVAEDDFTSAEININNDGTSIGDWTAWIDFGESEGGTSVDQIYYDLELDPETGSNLTGTCLLTESPILVEVGAMFPGAAYAGTAMGTELVSVQYPVFTWVDNAGNPIGTGLEPNTPMTFRVYGQGLNGQPGALLAEKVIPADQIVVDDWNVAVFDEPVVLRGFNVWVTCEFTQAICIQDEVDCGAVFVFDGGTASEFGDYYRTNGGGAFNKCSEVFSSDHGNFHIRANCQGTPVNATWATLSKPEGTMAIGGTDNVTVNVNAIGLAAGDERTADIVFSTNDPENPTVVIPLHMIVDLDAVEETTTKLATIYPNPAQSQVTLEGENLNSVAIYNVAGQLVRIVKLDNMVNNIDMNVESGVYFFSIYDNNGNNSVQRVVIVK